MSLVKHAYFVLLCCVALGGYGQTMDEWIIAAPEGFVMASYRVDSVPITEDMPGDTCLTVDLESGKGMVAYGPPVDTGSGLVRLEYWFYCPQPDVGLAVGTLDIPTGGSFHDVTGSIVANQQVDAKDFVEGWNTLAVFADPRGDAIIPVCQVLGTSSSPVTVHIGEFVVTPLHDLSPSELARAVHPGPTATKAELDEHFGAPFGPLVFMEEDFRAFNIADINCDGFPDLLGELHRDWWAFRLGRGDGVFQENVDVMPKTKTERSLFLVDDFNSDGIPDLLNFYRKPNPPLLFLAKEPGEYNDPIPLDIYPYERTLLTGDYNNDGKNDLVRYRRTKGYEVTDDTAFLFFAGKGDGTFGTPIVSTLDVAPEDTMRSVRAVDINSDGALDLAVLINDHYGSILWIYEGDGEGRFQLHQFLEFTGWYVGFAFADLNEDNLLDLVTLGSPENIGVRLAMSDDRFRAPAACWADVQATTVSVDDINRDGHLDLLVTGTPDIAVTLYGRGDGTFLPPIGYRTAGGFWKLTDVNGDDYPDLVQRGAVAINALGDGPSERGTPMLLPGSHTEAAEILNRVLEVCSPWLHPCPIEAWYSYSTEPENIHVFGGGMNPVRVGSLTITPLHNLYHNDSPYRVGIWRDSGPGEAAITLEFARRSPGFVQFGGHRATTLTAVGSGTHSYDLLIDTERYVPLYIYDDEFTRWSFEWDFPEIDGGMVPSRVTYEQMGGRMDGLKSIHEFQIVDGIWILEEGEAVQGDTVKSRVSLSDFQLIRRLE